MAQIYADSVSGDDTTGTGALGNPYQTLPQCVSVATTSDAICLIDTGTPYDVTSQQTIGSGTHIIGVDAAGVPGAGYPEIRATASITGAMLTLGQNASLSFLKLNGNSNAQFATDFFFQAYALEVYGFIGSGSVQAVMRPWYADLCYVHDCGGVDVLTYGIQCLHGGNRVVVENCGRGVWSNRGTMSNSFVIDARGPGFSGANGYGDASFYNCVAVGCGSTAFQSTGNALFSGCIAKDNHSGFSLSRGLVVDCIAHGNTSYNFNSPLTAGTGMSSNLAWRNLSTADPQLENIASSPYDIRVDPLSPAVGNTAIPSWMPLVNPTGADGLDSGAPGLSLSAVGGGGVSAIRLRPMVWM